MAPYIAIHELKEHLGSDVCLKGWVMNVRSSGSIAFLQLRDGSGFVQAIVNRAALRPEVHED